MCFAYTTFHHMIVLYHHVECMCLPSRTLIDTLCSDSEVPLLLSELVPASSLDRSGEAYSIIRTILQQKIVNLNECVVYADALQERLDALRKQKETASETEASATTQTVTETPTRKQSDHLSPSSSTSPEQHAEQSGSDNTM